MYIAAVAIVLALVGTYILTPLVMKLAVRFGVIDHPGERRVHERPTPRCGGIAIYVGFLVAVGAAVALEPHVGFEKQLLGVILGGTIVAAAGLLDDKYNLSPALQIAAILATGLVLMSFGGKISYISKPFGPGIWWFKPWLAAAVTLIWIVAVTKTVDLMDGLDGLAAGICAIASATLLVMSIHAIADVHRVVIPTAGHLDRIRLFTTVMILSGAILGASLGFLRFNYPPARIFMGTVGAQFMGFVLASASVIGAFKVAALVAIAVPLLVLAVPILDAAFVMLMRAIGRRRVYEADKSHMHHRLLERGLSHGQTIWVIYLLTVALSAVGLVLFWYGR
ncbi:MAG: undecaprenyl/decaprenyl-phosphate alpha-N-acetylglucosaminyl 1-phosphate transferase [Armatimonadetes bacterium]|nr:undecaprenyl/decaprenyl-phosphate alpha-N-acetylglucosaminyl 1-phosphate transferase [Armatimonadota bacterium]